VSARPVRKLTPKQRGFLAAYAANGGNISAACREAECERKSYWHWVNHKDEAQREMFKSALADSHEQACQSLEDEATRRAVQGIDKPVFYQGEQCGTIREYSDVLLIFRMKGALPEKYGDKSKTEITGPKGGPLQVVFVNDWNAEKNHLSPEA
jgi:hypothetical protein